MFLFWNCHCTDQSKRTNTPQLVCLMNETKKTKQSQSKPKDTFFRLKPKILLKVLSPTCHVRVVRLMSVTSRLLLLLLASSTASVGWQCSPPDLNRESEDTPDRTPERMSEDMPERNSCQITFQYMPKNCQIEMSWWGSLEVKYIFWFLV